MVAGSRVAGSSGGAGDARAPQDTEARSMQQVASEWATIELVKKTKDQCRANDELILKAVKEVDRRLRDMLDAKDHVIIRMARQVDYVQNYLKEQDSNYETPSHEHVRTSIQRTSSPSAAKSTKDILAQLAKGSPLKNSSTSASEASSVASKRTVGQPVLGASKRITFEKLKYERKRGKQCGI
eukprot:gene8137-1385_t